MLNDLSKVVLEGIKWYFTNNSENFKFLSLL